MVKVGDLLSVILDEVTLKKAQEIHSLFSAWKALAGEQLAGHSRIVELEHAVLLVEADHPGWIQILQMKEAGLLAAVQRRFPELTINGIAFRLSRQLPTPPKPPGSGARVAAALPAATATATPPERETEDVDSPGAPPGNRFRDLLQRMQSGDHPGG